LLESILVYYEGRHCVRYPATISGLSMKRVLWELHTA
jgi:hypothetical protein